MALLSDQLFWQALKNTAFTPPSPSRRERSSRSCWRYCSMCCVPGRTLWRLDLRTDGRSAGGGRDRLDVDVQLPLRTGQHRVGLDWDHGTELASATALTMPSMILLSFWSVGNAVVIYLAGLVDVPRFALRSRAR